MAGSFSLGEAILGTGVDLAGLHTGLDKAEGQTKQSFSRISNIMDTALGTALGIATTQLLPALGNAWDFVTGKAFDAVASYERLGASITNLVAKEISRGNVVEKTSTMVRQLTEGEKGQLVELNEQYRLLQIGIEKQKTAIAGAAEKHGQNSLAVEEATIKYNRMQRELESLGGQISSLQGAEGQLVSVITKHREGTMSLKDAMAEAGPRAQELLGWIQKLAIQSPFSQEGVAQAFKTALAYGFTTKESQRLTTAMIDFAAGSGASEDSMGRISLALGQIRAKGKLAGGEMLQLTEAGLSVREILIESGKVAGLTAENFDEFQRKGLIPANEAILAITESLEKDFGGAAKAQSGTLAGLRASLEDLTQVGIREFFTGTFTAIQPLLAAFVDKMSNPAFMQSVSRMGSALGEGLLAVLPIAERVGQMIDRVVGIFNYLVTTFQSGTSPMTIIGNLLVEAFGLKTGLQLKTSLQGFLDLIAPLVLNLRKLWSLATDIASVWVQLFVKGLGEAQEFVSAVLPGLVETINSGVVGLTTLLAQNAEGIFAFLPNLIAGLQPIIDGIWNVVTAFGESMPMIMSYVQTAFASVQTAFAAVSPEVVANIGNSLNTLAEFWRTHGETVMAMVGTAFNGAVIVVSAAVLAISTAVEVAMALINGVVSFRVALMKGDWQGAWDAMLLTFSTVGAAIQTAISAFCDVVLGLLGTNAEEVNAVWGGVWDLLKIITDTATVLIGVAISDFLTTWTENFKEAGLIVQTTFENIYKWLFEQIEDFVDIGKQIVIGIANGILFGAGWVVQALMDTIKRAVAAATGALGIESPSTFMADMIGLPMGQGVAVGLLESAPYLEGAMRELTGDVVDNSRNNNFYLTAEYKYQNERSLRDEVRMLALLA